MQVIIMRGIPGSGKSTYVKNETYSYTFSVDDYHYVDGVWRFNPTKLSEYHNHCLWTYEQFLLNWPSDIGVVIVDNTNISEWEVAAYYRLAEIHTISVKVVTCVCGIATAHKRNVHNVPLATIIKMHNRLMNTELPPWCKQEYVLTD